MRTRFTGREIAHVWAHKSSTHGRCDNQSFDEHRFFSYATCIAERVTINGDEFVIVNHTSYSNTTSKQQSRLRGAISHLPQIGIYHVRRGSQQLVPWDFDIHKRARTKWAKERIKDLIDLSIEYTRKAKRARTFKDMYEREALGYFDQIRRIVNLFDLKPVELNVDKLVEQRAEIEKRERQREALRQKELEKQQADQVSDWLAGKRDAYFPSRIDRVYLRVREPSAIVSFKSIETSKGVFVPYKDGKRAFEFYLKMKAKGWRRNGEQFKVGNYQLDSIGEGGIVAGCHRITDEEITRFATQEGWM